MVTAQNKPEKSSFFLVTFIYDDLSSPSFSRFTNLESDYSEFESEPSMAVDLPANTGTLEPKDLQILMPLNAFTSEISSGLPHSPVFVRVEELIRATQIGVAAVRKTRFFGQVQFARRNYQGRADTVAVEARSIKARLRDISMGVQCGAGCANALFSPGCGLTESDHRKTGQIASIDGKEVTISTPNGAITAPTAPGGDNSRFWERGFLRRNGLSIPIHLWKASDPTVFVLRRRPPDDWLLAGSSSITFVPGCHKTKEDCENVWDNLEGQSGSGGFAGFGIAMLPYNPLFESPQ